MHNKPDAAYYTQESERLIFRALSLNDVPAFLPFFDRDDYMRFLGQNLDMTQEERARFWIGRQVQRENEGEFGQLALIEKESGNFVGVGGIISREVNGSAEYEVTYSLLPAYWGRGYAREMARHFLDFLKESNWCTSAISMIHPENEASIKVARANGLAKEGSSEFMGIPVEIYRIHFS